MDLSLLPHLSERALREEAERRGIVFEGLERDALVAAIRAHESKLMTVPPAHHPVAYAPTVPAASDPPSALSAARSLLGRVVGIARSALERRSEPPPPPPAAVPSEPIRTRSLARLLQEQGHLERALAIVRELAAESASDEELARWVGQLERQIAERALQERSRAADAGVELVASAGQRGVVWKIDDGGLDRARALLGAPGELTLRVVRIVVGANHSVESQQEDRRPLPPSGWELLDAPAQARLVVAVGLTEGARFVSIAHASA